MTNRDPAVGNGANNENWIRDLPPGWRQFIEFCRQIRHGELERVAIQDGVPVLVELTRRKVKFGNHR